MYISDSTEEVVVKIVQTVTELGSLSPLNYKGLIGYYVFNKKGVCNGFARRMWLYTNSAGTKYTKFSSWGKQNFQSAQNAFKIGKIFLDLKTNSAGTKYTKFSSWGKQNFQSAQNAFKIGKIFLDLKDDGLLKYSGIKEFIEQKPTKTIKTGITINGKYQYKYFTNHAKDILMFVNKTLKYPIVEKIVKEGLAEELVNSDKTAVPKTFGQKVIQVDLKAKTVPEAFGVTKSLLRYYKSAKKKLGCAITMQTLQELYSLDNSMVGEDAYWLDKHNVPVENIVKIQKVLPEMTVSKITSYLERVRIGQMFDAVPASEQWRDYLDACKSIGMDMHDNHVLYPRALKTEHDIVMAKQKFIADESLNSEFIKAVEKYRFLEYHKDDYFIKIPESMEAMFEEGRKLKHCCGRYVDDVIEKTAFVLFLRRKINPEEPFLSIEVSPDMTVHQVRGINDSYVSVQKDALEINKFLHSWAKMKHLYLDIR